MNITQRRIFFERLKAQNPHPTTELNYTTTFELLIAVMLSAQSTDIRVNEATSKLFPMANTPKAILELGEKNLKEYIKILGLFNSKARHIMQACQLLVEKYNSEVPNTREQLESLPGVGRKTANVVLNTAFGEPTMAVDTHIFRVANRTGLAHGKNPREVEDELVRNIEPEFLHDAHHWLILHGRYVCTARKPNCGMCVVNDLCDFIKVTAKSSVKDSQDLLLRK
jgi:endonuclease III